MITRRRAIRTVLLIVVAALTANLIRGRFLRSAPVPHQPVIRFAMPLSPDRALDSFAVSPDGNTIAYAAEAADARLHLFVHPLAGGADRELPEAIGAHNPFFSPDSGSIGYFSRDAIWIEPTGGGPPTRVCGAPEESAGATWTDDGRIVFAPLEGAGLMAVVSGGGTPVALTTLSKRDSELAHGWPHALPGGAVLFTVAQRGRDPHLETLSARGARSPRLAPAIGQAAFVSAGFIVYSYLGDLYALPFDLDGLKATGVPIQFAKGVQTSSGFGQLGQSGFAMSRQGMLAWVRATPDDANSELVTVDAAGRTVPLKAAPAAYQTPRISPDGRYIAVAARAGLMTRDLLVLNRGGDKVVATLRGGDHQSPAWMPDGRLSFASNESGNQRIYATADRRFDRPVTVRPLFSMDVTTPRNPSSWVRQPPLLAFYEIDPFRARDVMIYHVGEAVLPIAATPANERSPVLSPDGRFIAWVSDATGRDEIYTKAIDGQQEPTRVSTSGGGEPVWTKDGLMYRDGDRFVRNGKTVLEGRFEKDPGANAADYDVDPSSKQVLLLKSARRPDEIRVEKNWRPTS